MGAATLIEDLAALAYRRQRPRRLDGLPHGLEHLAAPAPGLGAGEPREVGAEQRGHGRRPAAGMANSGADAALLARSKNPRSISLNCARTPRSAEPSSVSTMQSPSRMPSSGKTCGLTERLGRRAIDSFHRSISAGGTRRRTLVEA